MRASAGVLLFGFQCPANGVHPAVTHPSTMTDYYWDPSQTFTTLQEALDNMPPNALRVYFKNADELMSGNIMLTPVSKPIAGLLFVTYKPPLLRPASPQLMVVNAETDPTEVFEQDDLGTFAVRRQE